MPLLTSRQILCDSVFCAQGWLYCAVCEVATMYILWQCFVYHKGEHKCEYTTQCVNLPLTRLAILYNVGSCYYVHTVAVLCTFSKVLDLP